MAGAEVTAPTAVVAGGAGSIGRVLCRGLADHGFRVVILDAAAGADEVGRDVGAEARRCDLTDHAAIRDSVSDLDRVDVLVNSVGSWPRAAVDSFDPVEWDRLIRLNLSAPMYTVAALLPQLRAARGSVVNLSSTTALRGAPTMIALGRDGHPGDIAGAVLFFATQGSEFVTGQSLIVDGGQLFG
jgi:NAD(P)-dependent dehydrogenase (short-subunit alcohol dehydrogenase family)